MKNIKEADIYKSSEQSLRELSNFINLNQFNKLNLNFIPTSANFITLKFKNELLASKFLKVLLKN